MRAVIYARYSSENQREASIEDQVRLCSERCRSESWEIAHVFQDRALSGASALRPGYQSLLAAAREHGFNIVVAEALDRLSRDQEDVAALFKRLRFAGIKLFTLAEGEISELHIGLKGTMNALFLKDLALKVHRGLRGRVEAGHSGGGNAYGYRVVRRLSDAGILMTGERQIDEAEAHIVVRIFKEYAVGASPQRIALSLNRDGIPAPRTGAWSASTINGNRARGTGILNNELYVGRLCWNRLTYIKDPDTGKRRSRPRADAEHIVKAVPELRIVPQCLWDAARVRQASLDRKAPAHGRSAAGFWSKQRPRYLFSGLMKCGVCGGGFSKISALHFGCSTARNKGVTACGNRLAIRVDLLESTVLGGLRSRLMDPELFAVFVCEFTAEWNRLQAEASGDIEASRSELQRIKAQTERLVDALANGTPAAAVNGRLEALADRQSVLEAELQTGSAPAPRLHPNLAEVYRKKVAELSQALGAADSGEARELVRGLVDAILLVPEDGKLRIELRGELAAILSLASAGKSRPALGDALSLSQQVKMVAGTGFEPVTFRL